MFTSGPWSVVFAHDAKTGELLWQYDPQVPRERGKLACCDVVNRGVAVWKGKVFVGTIDGRLIALDAGTGEPVWQQLTIDPERPYTITGAPRVVHDKVIIGNGGAELGVRGYITAYDTQTGAQAWRFYTVPGDPAKPFEGKHLEKAAATWRGGKWWEIGGGGTVWDSMAYDPDLNLLYIGVGNGSPWNRYIRSPGWRRQPVPVIDRRHQSRRRHDGVVLPDDARRYVGLHRDAAHDSCRHSNRRELAQGDHAGAEERIFLRHRPHERRVHFGRGVRAGDVGHPHRSGDRAAGREPRRAIRERTEDDSTVAVRCAQLASDDVQSDHRTRLHPRARSRIQIRTEQRVQVSTGRVEPRRRHGARNSCQNC